SSTVRQPPNTYPLSPTRRSSDLTLRAAAPRSARRVHTAATDACCARARQRRAARRRASELEEAAPDSRRPTADTVRCVVARGPQDRKSTRLNSSHVAISYAVFCL